MAMPEFGTSYFGVEDIRHARTDLERFREAGLTGILHTFGERRRRYYEGTMEEVIRASKEEGFRVYVCPWSVGNVFGGEELSALLYEEPTVQQRSSTGQRLPVACFNTPEFRRYMADWAKTAVDIGADVIFWDEPRWGDPTAMLEAVPDGLWNCRCGACQEKYRNWYDEPMPATITETVREFREASLLEFLDEMMAIVEEAGALNTVCLMPTDDPNKGIVDWAPLAENDHLDMLSTDPYWLGFADEDESVKEFVAKWGDRVVSLAEDNGIDSQLWIQGFKQPSGDESVENVRIATEEALDSGVDSIFMWGYDGSRTISQFASAEPERIWQAYLDALPGESSKSR